MLKSIIRTLLQKFIDDIDSDNCNITMEQQSKIISVLSNIANPDQRMSKIQACDYLGVSRATFDNYVRDGFIPKGIKQEGFKELSWQKSDLDIFLSTFEHLSDCAEQIVKHGKKLMHCLSELESKSGEHYMERYGKRRRGGMRDSDYDDEDYPRYY